MNKLRLLLSFAAASMLLSSCMIVRPGEVGLKQKFGKLSERVYKEGAYPYNPFTTTIIKTPTRTVNMEVILNLPSKEGLNINSNISILYRIDEERVPMLISRVGNNYENIISSVFRSASADICAKFMAKDMHSGKRGLIEEEIAMVMNQHLNERGIEIEAVLMKTIQLPPGLYNSIEGRLEAEQEVMRMQFLLEQEKLEAERKVIEAKGQRDAQEILSEGLTPQIIEFRSIEAFQKLAESPNAKVIITNGKTPFLVEGATAE
jgi:prohibitin 1